MEKVGTMETAPALEVTDTAEMAGATAVEDDVTDV